MKSSRKHEAGAKLERRAAELRKMAADPSLISGIHNYCDRWCERCPQTHRCLSFRMEQARQGEQGDANPEENPEAFGEALFENLTLTLHLLRQEAEKHGIDLNAQEVAVYQDLAAEERLERRKSPLVRAARHYTDVSRRLLKALHAATPGLAAGWQHEASLGIGNPEKTIADLGDAVEVISWYQHFIEVKLSRAEFGRRTEPDDEFNSGDADGSAKVALIAIDRSIAAWAQVRRIVSEQTDEILQMLVQLERLRAAAEKVFPRARAFRRPGFDPQD